MGPPTPEPKLGRGRSPPAPRGSPVNFSTTSPTSRTSWPTGMPAGSTIPQHRAARLAAAVRRTRSPPFPLTCSWCCRPCAPWRSTKATIDAKPIRPTTTIANTRIIPPLSQLNRAMIQTRRFRGGQPPLTTASCAPPASSRALVRAGTCAVALVDSVAVGGRAAPPRAHLAHVCLPLDPAVPPGRA
jgi:hypothetical protein